MDHVVKTQPQTNDYFHQNPNSEVTLQPYDNCSHTTDLVFNKVTIRLGFIRKVFGIFTTQIILTLGLIALTNLIPEVKTFLNENLAAFLALPLLIALVILLILVSCKETTRTFPANFIYLGIFTLSLGFGVAVLATLSEEGHVLYACGILLSASLTITLYTFQTKFDLKWYGHLLIMLAAVGLASLICYAILPKESSPNVLLISAMAGLIVSIYLAILVHVTMSGDCCVFHPENYVLTSLYAYLVLVSVFLLALLIMGGDKCDGCGDCNGDCGSGNNCYCCGGGGDDDGRHMRRDDHRIPPDAV